MKKAVAVCGGKQFRCNVAETFLEKAIGIMFCKKKFVPLLIAFNRSGKAPNALHSFFCPPFDAFFLNGERIVDVKKNIPTNSATIVSSRDCNAVLEAPSGLLSAKRGGKIFFRETTL